MAPCCVCHRHWHYSIVSFLFVCVTNVVLGSEVTGAVTWPLHSWRTFEHKAEWIKPAWQCFQRRDPHHTKVSSQGCTETCKGGGSLFFITTYMFLRSHCWLKALIVQHTLCIETWVTSGDPCLYLWALENCDWSPMEAVNCLPAGDCPSTLCWGQCWEAESWGTLCCTWSSGPACSRGGLAGLASDDFLKEPIFHSSDSLNTTIVDSISLI